ncbi:MAG: DUF402 domain-containing protein [Tepidisphaeraceae bacterium]
MDESAECIRVYSAPGTALDSYRGQLTSISHNLRLYWPDRHWNLSVRWRPDWSLEDYYVNIATPAAWSGYTIDWVDLDLDLILSPDVDEPLLDDEDEFLRHSNAWHYPAELVETCWVTVEEVRQLMRNKLPPFDGSLAAWRPAGVL